MRTIKFRGKTIAGDDFPKSKWVYGFLLITKSHKSLIKYQADDEWNSWMTHEVIQETVGQFTGLFDKNGKEIYEGDIVKNFDLEILIREVEFKHSGFGYDTDMDFIVFGNNHNFEWGYFEKNASHLTEVIGNTTDNHELLTDKK